MFRLAWAALVLAACGRISFDPLGSATTGDASTSSGDDDASIAFDSGPVDAVTACPVSLSCTAPMNVICNGRCITYCDDQLPESQAQMLCNFASSNLVNVRSAADDACVLALITSSGGIWLGYEQQAGATTLAGNWSWLGGAPTTYTNWALNEPQDLDTIENGEEQCTVKFTDDVWRDTACGELHPFACVR